MGYRWRIDGGVDEGLGGRGRTGLGMDGLRRPKEGMGLVLVPDGRGVGWVIVALFVDLAFFETMWVGYGPEPPKPCLTMA